MHIFTGQTTTVAIILAPYADILLACHTYFVLPGKNLCVTNQGIKKSACIADYNYPDLQNFLKVDNSVLFEIIKINSIYTIRESPDSLQVVEFVYSHILPMN